MNDFIGNGKAAVICVIEAPKEIVLGVYANQGFYLRSQFAVRNESSDTPACSAMLESQHRKLLEHYTPVRDKRLFLLSWTLTQPTPPNIKDFSDHLAVGLVGGEVGGRGIVSGMWHNRTDTSRTKALAADKALMEKLLPWVRKNAFPNIVLLDFMESADYVALAMAVNDEVFNT